MTMVTTSGEREAILPRISDCAWAREAEAAVLLGDEHAEEAVLLDERSEAEAKVEEFRSRSNLLMGSNTNSLSNQQLAELTTQSLRRRAHSRSRTKPGRKRSVQMLKSGRPIESGDITNSELI